MLLAIAALEPAGARDNSWSSSSGSTRRAQARECRDGDGRALDVAGDGEFSRCGLEARRCGTQAHRIRTILNGHGPSRFPSHHELARLGWFRRDKPYVAL